MKANLLMNNLFDVHSGEICDEILDIFIMDDKPRESLKDLILEAFHDLLCLL